LTCDRKPVHTAEIVERAVVCFPRRLQIGTVYVALSISNAVVRGVFSDLVADVLGHFIDFAYDTLISILEALEVTLLGLVDIFIGAVCGITDIASDITLAVFDSIEGAIEVLLISCNVTYDNCPSMIAGLGQDFVDTFVAGLKENWIGCFDSDLEPEPLPWTLPIFEDFRRTSC
jgi:hypothetical protein